MGIQFSTWMSTSESRTQKVKLGTKVSEAKVKYRNNSGLGPGSKILDKKGLSYSLGNQQHGQISMSFLIFYPVYEQASNFGGWT